VDTHRVVCSQMAVRLSALRTVRPFSPQENSWIYIIDNKLETLLYWCLFRQYLIFFLPLMEYVIMHFRVSATYSIRSEIFFCLAVLFVNVLLSICTDDFLSVISFEWFLQFCLCSSILFSTDPVFIPIMIYSKVGISSLLVAICSM
jgi:hypothetical protein